MTMAPLRRRPALLLASFALAGAVHGFAPPCSTPAFAFAGAVHGFVPPCSTPPLPLLGRAPPLLSSLRAAGHDDDDGKLVRGRVKFYDTTKGFGFIVPDGGSGTRRDDLFAHQSHINMEGFRFLRRNQRVRFRVNEREDGKKYATDICVMAEEEAEEAALAGAAEEEMTVAEVADRVAAHLEEIAPPEEISLTLKEEKEEVEKVEATAAAENEASTPDPFAGFKKMFGF